MWFPKDMNVVLKKGENNQNISLFGGTVKFSENKKTDSIVNTQENSASDITYFISKSVNSKIAINTPVNIKGSSSTMQFNDDAHKKSETFWNLYRTDSLTKRGATTYTTLDSLAKKEGVEQTQVLSPTFNLLYEYKIKKIKVMHYDLYRIKNIKELSQLGIFNENVNSIKIIEWPQLIESNVIDRLELHFSYASNENERKLISKGSGKWNVFNLDEL